MLHGTEDAIRAWSASSVFARRMADEMEIRSTSGIFLCIENWGEINGCE
jgi:hypothetical protein